MKFQQRKWRKALVLAVALAAPAVSPANAAEPQWPSGAYSYFVIDQDIRAVLAEFGRNMHIPVRVSESVPSMQIKGKIGAPSAKAFLQWMCDSYRLTWYFDGAVLQIMSQSELQNAYFDLGPVAPEEFNKRLQEAGIADERFPVYLPADLPQEPADVVVANILAGPLVDLAETVFAAAGLRVARNRPYAGGFCTRTYGRPQHGVHARASVAADGPGHRGAHRVQLLHLVAAQRLLGLLLLRLLLVTAIASEESHC